MTISSVIGRTALGRAALAALCWVMAGAAQAAAPEGHCLAASPAGACATGPVRGADGALVAGTHVYFDEPTTRYAHGVLGDAVEWGRLVYVQQGTAGPRIVDQVVLPPSRVFEDLVPRLHDLDGDGRFEIIVVESDARLGAQLSVYGLRGSELVKLTATPHIGRSNRWLAPLGAADLDGDGAVEIAYVDRPHLAKTLRVWRYGPNGLTEIAALSGLTNHRIGEAFISGGIRDCGAGPEVILADASWRQIVAVRLAADGLEGRSVAPFEGPASFAPVLACAR